MSASIDPYREWLGIEALDRPLDHYQLLGLQPFDDDLERIENAEMIQMAKVLRHEFGPEAAIVRHLCQELECAANCLRQPASKAQYDAALQARQVQPDKPEIDLSIKDEDELDDAALRTGETKPHHAALDLSIEDEDELLATTSLAPVVAASQADAAVSRTSGATAADDDSDRTQLPSLLEGLFPEEAKRGKKSSFRKASRSPAGLPAPSGTGSSRRLSLPGIPWQPLIGAALAVAGAFAVVNLAGMFWNQLPDPAPVLAQLQDPDPQVRIDAIDGLRHVDLDPHQVVAQLIQVLKQDSNESVRVAAANALVVAGPPRADDISELNQLLSRERHKGIKHLLASMVSKSETTAR